MIEIHESYMITKFFNKYKYFIKTRIRILKDMKLSPQFDTSSDKTNDHRLYVTQAQIESYFNTRRSSEDKESAFLISSNFELNQSNSSEIQLGEFSMHCQRTIISTSGKIFPMRKMCDVNIQTTDDSVFPKAQLPATKKKETKDFHINQILRGDTNE